MHTVVRICRVVAALILVTYGFAKLTGAQFTVLDSQLDRPMGQVSGFWLTWYYFGYSQVFGTAIALVQVGVGVALAFRRTALLAACVGLGVMTTIVLIDLTFGIDTDATVVALVATAALATVVWAHRSELVEVFWTRRAAPPAGAAHRWLKAAAVVVLLVVPALFTTFMATVNNRSPTPLDGTWEVTEGRYAPAAGQAPLTRVYFEHNRAFMAVFRYGETRRTHHFEVDPASSTLRVWRTWLRKDAQLFDGSYRLAGDRLVIRGRFADTPQPVELRLHRVDVTGARSHG